MRVVSVFAVSVAALVVSLSPLAAETGKKFQAVSDKLAAEAATALLAQPAGGDGSNGAQVLYERALVANPANIAALIGLGRTHEKGGRVGKSLKYYRQALELEPNHLDALGLQGKAFLSKEMLDRAEANRDKLSRLCPQSCQQLDDLEVAIEGYKAEVTAIESKGEEN